MKKIIRLTLSLLTLTSLVACSKLKTVGFYLGYVIDASDYRYDEYESTTSNEVLRIYDNGQYDYLNFDKRDSFHATYSINDNDILLNHQYTIQLDSKGEKFQRKIDHYYFNKDNDSYISNKEHSKCGTKFTFNDKVFIKSKSGGEDSTYYYEIKDHDTLTIELFIHDKKYEMTSLEDFVAHYQLEVYRNNIIYFKGTDYDDYTHHAAVIKVQVPVDNYETAIKRLSSLKGAVVNYLDYSFDNDYFKTFNINAFSHGEETKLDNTKSYGVIHGVFNFLYSKDVRVYKSFEDYNDLVTNHMNLEKEYEEFTNNLNDKFDVEFFTNNDLILCTCRYNSFDDLPNIINYNHVAYLYNGTLYFAYQGKCQNNGILVNQLYEKVGWWPYSERIAFMSIPKTVEYDDVRFFY